MKHAVLLLSGLALAAANPVITMFYSEIQTAPDSLERIEVHPRNWEQGFPIDLTHWRVMTSAGYATVNPGVVVADSSSYVVLDRSNLTGTFGLADDTDRVWLFDSLGDLVWTLDYPSGEQGNPYSCWAPLPGMSVALSEEWTIPPNPEQYFVWYADSTPTFGAASDDNEGGVSGQIRDQHGSPLDWATVQLSGPYGQSETYSYPAGQYRFHPTGPGVYALEVWKLGYAPGSYPDPVTVRTNEDVTGIDITLYYTGVTEAVPIALLTPAIRQQGRDLLVTGSGSADLAIYDLSGRLAFSLPVCRLPSTVSLPLRPGIYFCRLAGAAPTKVVIR